MSSMEDYITKGGYIEAIGRRKTSVARVRISKAGKPGFVVNGKNLKEYFPTVHLVRDIKNALEQAGEDFNVSVVVKGGGISSQAGCGSSWYSKSNSGSFSREKSGDKEVRLSYKRSKNEGKEEVWFEES